MGKGSMPRRSCTGDTTALSAPPLRSMNAAATITVEDGDKVNHGWSQLDIAKHSTNTFVSSLGDEDYVSVVTYSDGANVRHAAPRPRPAHAA